MVFGARDYVIKPVDSGRLREAANIALGQEERRQMRRAGQLSDVYGRGTVITVAGAKGGIGKSVLSVNLAVALRDETKRAVLIIDADTQFGDVATMLDVIPQHNVSDVVRQRASLDRTGVREFVTTHPPTGLDILAASEDEDAWGGCTQDEVKRLIDLYAQVYDFVIIDTAGAMDTFVRSLRRGIDADVDRQQRRRVVRARHGGGGAPPRPLGRALGACALRAQRGQPRPGHQRGRACGLDWPRGVLGRASRPGGDRVGAGGPAAGATRDEDEVGAGDHGARAAHRWQAGNIGRAGARRPLAPRTPVARWSERKRRR